MFYFLINHYNLPVKSTPESAVFCALSFLFFFVSPTEINQAEIKQNLSVKKQVLLGNILWQDKHNETVLLVYKKHLKARYKKYHSTLSLLIKFAKEAWFTSSLETKRSLYASPVKSFIYVGQKKRNLVISLEQKVCGSI